MGLDFLVACMIAVLVVSGIVFATWTLLVVFLILIPELITAIVDWFKK